LWPFAAHHWSAHEWWAMLGERSARTTATFMMAHFVVAPLFLAFAVRACLPVIHSLGHFSHVTGDVLHSCGHQLLHSFMNVPHPLFFISGGLRRASCFGFRWTVVFAILVATTMVFLVACATISRGRFAVFFRLCTFGPTDLFGWRGAWFGIATRGFTGWAIRLLSDHCAGH